MTEDDGFTPTELERLARIEAAPPAPESFDAPAAIRRLLALAATWEDQPTATVGGRVFRHCGRSVRDAIDGWIR